MHRAGRGDLTFPPPATFDGMSDHRFTIYESPIGPLTLTGDGTALTGLWFPGRGPAHAETDQRPEDFAPGHRSAAGVLRRRAAATSICPCARRDAVSAARLGRA